MKVRIFDDAARASHAVARLVARQLELQPASVLGLPTGRTSVAVYKELVRLGPDFSRARTFNLDEFVGLPGTGAPQLGRSEGQRSVVPGVVTT